MKKLLVGVVLGAILASAGIAVASIPDSNGVIHGCYLTSGNPNVRGALRVIDTDAGQTCGSGETAISWDQQGGARYYLAGDFRQIPPSPPRVTWDVNCDTDDLAVSSGWTWGDIPEGDIRDLHIIYNRPNRGPQSFGLPEQWNFGVWSDLATVASIETFVYCLDLPPYRNS